MSASAATALEYLARLNAHGFDAPERAAHTTTLAPAPHSDLHGRHGSVVDNSLVNEDS